MGESFPRVAVVRSKTGGTSGSSSLQPKKSLDGTSSKRELKGGTYFQRDFWKAGVCRRDLPKSSFDTIEYWRDLRLLFGTAPNRCLDGTEPERQLTRRRISRETSGRLAYVGEISPRTVSVRLIIREASGSSLVQRQNDTLIVPNSRENSRGGGAFPEKPLEG